MCCGANGTRVPGLCSPVGLLVVRVAQEKGKFFSGKVSSSSTRSTGSSTTSPLAAPHAGAELGTLTLSHSLV